MRDVSSLVRTREQVTRTRGHSANCPGAVAWSQRRRSPDPIPTRRGNEDRGMRAALRVILYAALASSAACDNDDDKTTEPATVPLPAEVVTLRASLAPYASLTLAKAAGYNVA